MSAIGARELLATFPDQSWTGPFAAETLGRAGAALENGSVVFFPQMKFDLFEGERGLLSAGVSDGKSKNVNFDPRRGVLRGAADPAGSSALAGMLRRFSDQARALVAAFMPGYREALEWGLTTFRPVEIAGRQSSWRKDDTRLHVDAFPSRPTQGRRILRVFANVGDKPRVWRLGQPFESVAQTFAPSAKLPLPGSAWLLERLRIVRGRRTAFDHVMIQVHDGMKADQAYQRSALQGEFEFPPGSAWVVYTDQVSHAAISGQFALEQTFFVPVAALSSPSTAPIRVLERLLSRRLG